MSKLDEKIFAEQQEIMFEALTQMAKLAENNTNASSNFLLLSKILVIGVMSNAADLAELTNPGASHMFYSEIEAAARNRGVEGIAQAGGQMTELADIAPDDMTKAMNYVGEKLSTTLFKATCELPSTLRTEEMMLRGIEALMSNLLHQKFSNAHEILDSFCEHVHCSIDDLEERVRVKEVLQ